LHEPAKPAALGASAPRSLAQAVYADVRAEILAGRYGPGSKLSPRRIATESNVSLSVVREALTRLTEQGLVVAEPQVGFSVVPLDIGDLRDLTRVRILIEGTALRDAVENADVEYETEVVATHHRMSRTTYLRDGTKDTITDEWENAHSQFHSALLSASTSARLRHLADSLRDASGLYRRWAGGLATSLAPRDVPSEHSALMAAVLDRDADRAVALVSEHIKMTTLMLAAYAETHDSDVETAGNAELDQGLA
jgi:DNA-binding GntR family transcriptional regulator